MRRLTRGFLTLGVLASLSSVARADEPDRWSRRFVVGARLDVAPIVTSGLFVTAEVAPVKWVSLEVGAGGTPEIAPAWLAMIHGQIPVGALAFGMEAGVVAGRLDVGDGCRFKAFRRDCFHPAAFVYDSASLTRRVSPAVFGRAAATVTWRSESDWQVRAHAGVTGLLDGGSAHCELGGMAVPASVDCSLPGGTVPVGPYAGVGVGVPFDFLGRRDGEGEAALEDPITFDCWARPVTDQRDAVVQVLHRLRPELGRLDLLRATQRGRGGERILAAERIRWADVPSVRAAVSEAFGDMLVLQSGYAPGDIPTMAWCERHCVHFGGCAGCHVCAAEGGARGRLAC